MIKKHKNIVYDQWLAQILQRDVYKVIVNDDFMEKTQELESIEHKLLGELESENVFLYSKVPTSFLAAVKFLEERHFNLIDTNVIFEKPITVSKGQRHILSRYDVRFAASGDQRYVVDLAKRSFSYSRFHLDSAFTREIADTIKAEWVKSYFTGDRGNSMVVASVGQEIVGFLLLLYDEDSLIIDLVATDEKQRRRGIAEDMIAYAESQCQGFGKIRVGTQLVNVPSLRMYEGMGFNVATANYVFHYHN